MPSDDLIKRCAPFLRFDTDERHFLARPDEFRSRARFRRSQEDEDDLGWNRSARQWQKSNESGSNFVGEVWDSIEQEILLATKEKRPGGVKSDGKVSRPQDGRNLWGKGRKDGFFLELEDGFGHDASGELPKDLVSPVSVFHDLHRFDGKRVPRWFALSYWFFYIYNWNNMFKHEGDWEHITLYFADGEEEALSPRAIFYAAHNSGFLVSGRSPVFVTDSADQTTLGGPPSAEATHPIVYVMRHGHPSYPIVDDPKRYSHCARTWRQPIPSIEDTDWHRFDGAWGEVGSFFGHTTGPLGPWFKRCNKVLIEKGLL